MNEVYTDLENEGKSYLLETYSFIVIDYYDYLTKEQIEGEGWSIDEREVSKRLADYGVLKFVKGNSFLRWDMSRNLIDMSTIDWSRETTRPLGFADDVSIKCECKDINTFQLISKLLHI